METRSAVEVADILTRKRAKVVAAATLMFLVAQIGNNPFLNPGHLHSLRLDFWAINALLLLVGLATGGTLLRRRRIRRLMNDEVTQGHLRTAMVTGFWVAMAIAMSIYWLPAALQPNGEGVVYIIITASVSVALLAFSWMEHRASRDE